MLAIMRRDPFWNGPFLKWVLVLGFNAFLLEGMRRTMAVRAGKEGTSDIVELLMTAAVLWLPTIVVLAAGRFGERCGDLDLGLPVPARRLWLAHVSVSFLASSAMIAISGAMMLLHRVVVGMALPSAAPPFARLALPLVAALLLTLVMLQTWKPALHRIPRDFRYWIQAILMLAAGYALVVLLSIPRAPVALIPLILALALAYRTCRSIPTAFLLAAREASGEGRPHAAAAPVMPRPEWKPAEESPAPGTLSFRLFLLRAVYTAASKKRGALLTTYLLLLGWGYLLGAISQGGVLRSGEDMELFQSTLLVYLLFTLSVTPLSRLYLVDVWPLSRSFLFGFLVGVPSLFLMAGYGAGVAVHGAGGPDRELVVYKAADEPGLFPPYRLKYPALRIPQQHTRIAWDGQVPEVGSSWGEGYPAWSMPVVAGLPMRLYSPYCTQKEASPRFVALQISRAAEAVYGRPIPAEEILGRYLEKGSPLTIRADYPGLQAPRRVSFVPTLMAAVFAGWMAVTAVFFQFCRADVSDGLRKSVFIGLAVLILAVHIGFFVSGITGFVRPDVASAFWRKSVVWLVRSLPAGEFMVWVLCVWIVVLAYRLAKRRFERIEMPTPRAASEM